MAMAVIGSTHDQSRATAFKGPLEVPARYSTKVGSSTLISITRTGEQLVAVGLRGVIVYSGDDGQHWKQAAVPVSTDLTAVNFPTPKLGWAVGHEGTILHTSDGGRTWKLQATGWQLDKRLVSYYKKKAESGQEKFKRLLNNAQAVASHQPALGLLGVWFRNARVGYIVGEFNTLFKTTDGGKTWTPWSAHTQNPRFMHLYDIQGVNGHVYIAGERGLFLRLDHRTHTFAAVHTPYQGSYFGIATSGSLVVIYGLRGHAYLSRDGGHTWHEVPVNTDDTFTGGAIANGRILLSTKSGGIFYSTDGGETFQATPIATSRSTFDALPLGDGKVALAGPTGPRVIRFAPTANPTAH